MEKDFIYCMICVPITILIIYIIIKPFITTNKIPFHVNRQSQTKIDDELKNVDSLIINGIPAIVYQSYNNNTKLTSTIVNKIQNNIVNNVEFEFYFFNENDARYFIETNFDNNILDIYDSLSVDKKNNLWKYCILYKTGGVYIDINLDINDSLVNIITKLKSSSVFIKNSSQVIIVPPNDPIIKKLLDSFIYNKKESYSDIVTHYQLYVDNSDNETYIRDTKTNNVYFYL